MNPRPSTLAAVYALMLKKARARREQVGSGSGQNGRDADPAPAAGNEAGDDGA